MKYSSKDEVAAAFKAGEIELDEMTAEIARLSRRPFTLDVGDKGWLKIKFDGFRFPVSLALEQAEQLFSDEGAQRVQQYIAANRNRFKVKAA